MELEYAADTTAAAQAANIHRQMELEAGLSSANTVDAAALHRQLEWQTALATATTTAIDAGAIHRQMELEAGLSGGNTVDAGALHRQLEWEAALVTGTAHRNRRWRDPPPDGARSRARAAATAWTPELCTGNSSGRRRSRLVQRRQSTRVRFTARWSWRSGWTTTPRSMPVRFTGSWSGRLGSQVRVSSGRQRQPTIADVT